MTTKTHIGKAQKAARLGLFRDLKFLQDDLKDLWAHMSVPEDWNYLEEQFPEVAEKKKVTLYLDADMAKWFADLGKGYQGRINAILRIYWRGLISGDVKAYHDPHEVAPRRVAYLEETYKRFSEVMKEFETVPGMDQCPLIIEHRLGFRRVYYKLLKQKTGGGESACFLVFGLGEPYHWKSLLWGQGVAKLTLGQ